MNAKSVLMVEGPDDEHVVKNLCGCLELGEIGKIRPYGGISRLLDGIGVQIKESGIISLGVMVDADTDLSARWQSVTDRLKSAGYENIPLTPDDNGTIMLPPKNTLLPKIGIWLMPDNRQPGILEDFLRLLIPAGNDLLRYAEKSIEGIPGEKLFSPSKQTKALVHTWLSWQEEPGKPFGQAISARYFNPCLPTGIAFSEWLKKLFFQEADENSENM
jgi:hypothetical protein